MSQDRKQSSYPPSHCHVSHQCLPFVSFFFHVACYNTSTSTLATSDQFNWPEIMRLLIYYKPLIEWKPFTVTIVESFIRPSLSLSIPFSISFSLSSLYLYLSIRRLPFKREKFMGYVFPHHFATLSAALGIFTPRFLSFQSCSTLRGSIGTSRIPCNRNVSGKVWPCS